MNVRSPGSSENSLLGADTPGSGRKALMVNNSAQEPLHYLMLCPLGRPERRERGAAGKVVAGVSQFINTLFSHNEVLSAVCEPLSTLCIHSMNSKEKCPSLPISYAFKGSAIFTDDGLQCICIVRSIKGHFFGPSLGSGCHVIDCVATSWTEKYVPHLMRAFDFI